MVSLGLFMAVPTWSNSSSLIRSTLLALIYMTVHTVKKILGKQESIALDKRVSNWCINNYFSYFYYKTWAVYSLEALWWATINF